MKLIELCERYQFARNQATALKALAEEATTEAGKVLAFLREQGIMSLSTPHEFRCEKEVTRTHKCTAPQCCIDLCWCQRDLSGPTEVGKDPAKRKR